MSAKPAYSGKRAPRPPARLAGKRATRQRGAVVEALEEAAGFRSAQEIHRLIRRRGRGVGLATVYRSLQSLAESGEADTLVSDEGETLYRLCSRSDHHHHLVCRGCGLSVEVASPSVERWASQTARRHGFTDPTHDLEVWGLCPECSE